MMKGILSCVTLLLEALNEVPERVAVKVRVPLSRLAMVHEFAKVTDQLPLVTARLLVVTVLPLTSETSKLTVKPDEAVPETVIESSSVMFR